MNWFRDWYDTPDVQMMQDALPQPVRIYSPNPDAPQYAGMQPTVEPAQPWYQRAGNAIANAPNALWHMLPKEARDAYSSGFNALVDMTTPAAVRDYTTAAQDTARSAVQGDGWGTATNALATVNAALGAVPVAGLGIRAAQKGARDVGRVAGEGAQNFIRAYHGSPHSFDRFDLSKIGTGEGAQAYGHGLYFAENPTIATTYRAKVSAMQGKDAPTIGGKPINWDDPKHTAAFEVARHNGDRTAAADFYERTFAKGSPVPSIIRSGADLPEVKMPGSMYEVAIHADPAKFLDWDKPLERQAPEVRAALTALLDNKYGGGTAKEYFRAGNDFRDIYSNFDDLPREFVSKELAKSGIPGVKYLDAGSRDAGKGSRNYVVFDDKLIEILRKYGLLPLAGAAGYAAMPGQEQPQGGLF